MSSVNTYEYELIPLIENDLKTLCGLNSFDEFKKKLENLESIEDFHRYLIDVETLCKDNIIHEIDYIAICSVVKIFYKHKKPRSEQDIKERELINRTCEKLFICFVSLPIYMFYFLSSIF